MNPAMTFPTALDKSHIEDLRLAASQLTGAKRRSFLIVGFRLSQ